MEISLRISMSKHSREMIHGHSALKKSTSIFHIVLLHCCLYRGESAQYAAFIHTKAPIRTKTQVDEAYTCYASLLFCDSVNADMREHVNTSICLHLRQISVPVARLLRRSPLTLNASQEAGRLDNYRGPHPIQMSIKLFRAWHNTPH